MKEDDILIRVNSVSKKFSKDLKKSLQYGLMDLTGALFGKKIDQSLRPTEFWAVKDISFEVKRGECIGLVGHNGAGKSTLLKMLNGLIKPDRGTIEMRGRVGALIELGAGFNPILSGRENIYNNGSILGLSKLEIDDRINDIIEFSEIGDFIDSPVQNYSSGMKVRLGFAVAAHLEPDVLIIDEVLAVGDVGFRFKCLNAIQKMMTNTAVIFVSHSMPLVYRICNEVLVMNKGQKVIKTSNVGEGVEKYFEMFSGGEQNVSGSGEAQVMDCKLYSNGQVMNFGETITVSHGNDVEIHLKIKLEGHLEGAALQIVFWNQDMLPVADILTSDLSGYNIINNRESIHNIKVIVPEVKFNAGKHAFSIHITAPDMTRSYCRFDNAGFINMTSHFASGAQMLLPAHWEVVN